MFAKIDLAATASSQQFAQPIVAKYLPYTICHTILRLVDLAPWCSKYLEKSTNSFKDIVFAGIIALATGEGEGF
jgi:hypothetical protein